MAKKMTPLALMLMRNGEGQRRSEGGGRAESRMGNESWEQEQMRRMPTYMPPYGEPEMRRRDYSRNEYGRGEMEYARGEGGRNEGRRSEMNYQRNEGGRGENRRGEMNYPQNEYRSGEMNYSRGEYEGGGMENRRMGFGEQPMDNYEMEMRRRRRRSDGTFMHYGGEESEMGEPIRFGGMVSMGGAGMGGKKKMSREMAEEWVESMEGDDPAKPKGGKWTPEQIKPIAQKYGVPTDGERFWEFYAIMNAMYSDYYAVAKKYNTLNPDYFADLAMAFLNDKDAVKNKATVYYECIVNG